MITEDKKQLEIALTTYIALKKNQAECTGFIDGFEVAIKYLRQRQTLPIDSVSSCYAVFDEEANIVQLYQTEEKANKGLLEFQNSHPHTEFYIDTMQIN